MEALISSSAIKTAAIEAEAAVGNAVYILTSFYNHDCDPNAHIVWIDNVDAKLKALRDIEEEGSFHVEGVVADLAGTSHQNPWKSNQQLDIIATTPSSKNRLLIPTKLASF